MSTLDLIIPDIHLGLRWDGLSRDEDVFSFLDSLTEKYKTSEVNSVLFLGDVFDSPDVPHSLVADFMNWSDKFISYTTPENIRKIIILCGNHDGKPDFGRHGSPLEEIEAAKLAKVIWEPEIYNNRVCIPYCNTEKISESFKKEVCTKSGLFNLNSYCHLNIPNAVPGIELEIGRGVSYTLPDWVSEHCNKVYAGHIHKPQVLGNIRILGSAIKVSMAEAKDTKYYMELHTSDKILEVPVKIPNRNLYGFKLDVFKGDFLEQLKTITDTELTDAIVSVLVICPNEKANSFNWYEIENSLRKRCYHLRWSLQIIKDKNIRLKDVNINLSISETLKSYLDKNNVKDPAKILNMFSSLEETI